MQPGKIYLTSKPEQSKTFLTQAALLDHIKLAGSQSCHVWGEAQLCSPELAYPSEWCEKVITGIHCGHCYQMPPSPARSFCGGSAKRDAKESASVLWLHCASLHFASAKENIHYKISFGSHFDGHLEYFYTSYLC